MEYSITLSYTEKSILKQIRGWLEKHADTKQFVDVSVLSATLFWRVVSSTLQLSSSSVAPACTSLAFLYSQNSCRCDSSFPGWRNVFSLRSDWWSGLRPGQGPGPVCSGCVEREGGEKERWSTPPFQTNPQIPGSHGWKSLPAELNMLIHDCIRTNGGSWRIKSQTERQWAVVERSYFNQGTVTVRKWSHHCFILHLSTLQSSCIMETTCYDDFQSCMWSHFFFSGITSWNFL